MCNCTAFKTRKMEPQNIAQCCVKYQIKPHHTVAYNYTVDKRTSIVSVSIFWQIQFVVYNLDCYVLIQP